MSDTDHVIEAAGARPEVGKRSLKERAYEAIKELTVSGSFVPGTVLSERRLVALLGMSKTPIRAALERLEADGFVSVAPRQGIVIRELSLQEITDQFDIRILLEAYVVGQVAGRLTNVQVREVEDNLAMHRAAADSQDILQVVQCEMAFHLMFSRFYENGEIIKVMSLLSDKMYRVMSRLLRKDVSGIVPFWEDHRQIAQAVIEGDGSRAEIRLRRHLECGRLSLLGG